MSEHTKEPWAFHDHGVSELCIHAKRPPTDSLTDDSPYCIAVLDGEGQWAWQELAQREADARRIVACVNKFAGMSIEAVESMPTTVAQMGKYFAELLEQRDALLEVLKGAKSILEEYDEHEIIHVIDAAMGAVAQ